LNLIDLLEFDSLDYKFVKDNGVVHSIDYNFPKEKKVLFHMGCIFLKELKDKLVMRKFSLFYL